MKSVRRLLITTAAIAGMMALTATGNAIGPGYGPDAPSREGVEQSRENREYGEGATGTAPGGEVDRGSGCMRRDGGSGTGAGGMMDTGDTGRGTADPAASHGRPGNGAL